MDKILNIVSINLANYFALIELKRKYRRTILGTFWQTATFGIFIILMGLVWAKVWKTDISVFLPYLASGLITWNLISTSLNDSCLSIVAGESYLKNYKIDPWVFPISTVIRNYINFFHNLIIYILILIYFGKELDLQSIGLSLLGLTILFIALVNICTIISIIVVRFRDIQQIINLFTQVILFVTPIFFEIKALTDKKSAWYFDYNIIFQYVSLIREPLLNKEVAIFTYIITLTFTLIIFIVNYIILKKYKYRLVYWI